MLVRAAEMDMGSSRAEEPRAAFLKLKEKEEVHHRPHPGLPRHGTGGLPRHLRSGRDLAAAGTSFETPWITFETIFLGKLPADFKVSPEIEQFYEFKNAADVYKRTELFRRLTRKR